MGKVYKDIIINLLKNYNIKIEELPDTQKFKFMKDALNNEELNFHEFNEWSKFFYERYTEENKNE